MDTIFPVLMNIASSSAARERERERGRRERGEREKKCFLTYNSQLYLLKFDVGKIIFCVNFVPELYGLCNLDFIMQTSLE